MMQFIKINDVRYINLEFVERIMIDENSIGKINLTFQSSGLANGTIEFNNMDEVNEFINKTIKPVRILHSIKEDKTTD